MCTVVRDQRRDRIAASARARLGHGTDVDGALRSCFCFIGLTRRTRGGRAKQSWGSCCRRRHERRAPALKWDRDGRPFKGQMLTPLFRYGLPPWCSWLPLHCELAVQRFLHNVEHLPR